MKTFQKRVSLDLGLLKPLVAIPGDVTQDGEIDLVLGFQALTGESKMNIIIYTVKCSQSMCTISGIPNRNPFTSDNYPSILKIQGKNVLVFTQGGQIMSESFSTVGSEVSNFVNSYFSGAAAANADICADYQQIYYLDYNADCLLDLIIHCNSETSTNRLQFYKSTPQGLFEFQNKVSVSPDMNLVQLTVADISNPIMT